MRNQWTKTELMGIHGASLESALELKKRGVTGIVLFDDQSKLVAIVPNDGESIAKKMSEIEPTGLLPEAWASFLLSELAEDTTIELLWAQKWPEAA